MGENKNKKVYAAPTKVLPEHYHMEMLFPLRDFPFAVYSEVHPREVTEHDHDFIEMVFVTQGYGIHMRRSEGKLKAMEFIAGDVFVILPGEKHFFADCRNLWLFNILFRPDLLDREWQTLLAFPNLKALMNPTESNAEPKLHIPIFMFTQAFQAINRIIGEMVKQAPGFRMVVRNGLVDFLVLLGRISPQDQLPRSQTLIESEQHNAVYRAIYCIEQNLTRKFTLSELAREARMSEAHFCRRFKAITGLSPWDYLITRRLEKAKELLTTTDWPILEIALECGFCDSSYLTRLFRRYEKSTPTRYRTDHSTCSLRIYSLQRKTED